MNKKLKVEHKSRFLWICCLVFGLCFLSVAVGMASCQNKQKNNGNTITEPPPTTQPPSNTENPEASLRTYYENLVQELREELLQEREDRYISDYEYKQRLEELENALAAFESMTEPPDTPTMAPPETNPPETDPPETDPPETETEEPPSKNEVIFNYRMENNEIIITSYTGTNALVTVPSEINGYPVVAIADHAFQNTPVTTVILPGTVTSVGWFAFYGCFGLEIVSIPASVTSISYAAFDGCPNLTLICPADSYAARYAVSFGLKHEYV